MLTERKTRLEDTLNHLKREQADILGHLNSVVITDEQVADIISFCEMVKVGLDLTTFEDRRSLIEMLDVHGTLAVEDGQKVVYVKCLLEQQRLLQIRTSPLSSSHEVNTITLTARIVLDGLQGHHRSFSLADKLFSQVNIGKAQAGYS